MLRALALRKSLGSFALGAKLHAAIGARLERKGGHDKCFYAPGNVWKVSPLHLQMVVWLIVILTDIRSGFRIIT